MKVLYDSETDTLTVILAETPVAESDEDKPGMILDYDAAGNLVSLEILDTSRRVRLPTQIEYQMIPASPPKVLTYIPKKVGTAAWISARSSEG
jgi:uncharacterized protein YuzE